jgi:hypothetical protein
MNFKPDRNARVNQSMMELPKLNNQSHLNIPQRNQGNPMNQSINYSLIEDKAQLVRTGANIGFNDILDKPYMYSHPAMLANKGRHGSNPQALQNLIMIDKSKQN